MGSELGATYDDPVRLFDILNIHDAHFFVIQLWNQQHSDASWTQGLH